MKQLLIIISLLFSLSVIAQDSVTISPQTATKVNSTFGNMFERVGGFKGTFFPSGSGYPMNYLIPKNLDDSLLSALYFNKSNGVPMYYNPVTKSWRYFAGGSGGGSSYSPYALDTTIRTTGNTTVFSIPLPSLATYNLTVPGFGAYTDSLNGSTLIVSFAVAPSGSVTFHISGSYTSTTGYNFKPSFGVLVNTSSTDNDKLALTNLGLNRFRSGYSQGGSTPAYLTYANSGIKIIETYNHAVSVSGNATPFQTDTASFRSVIQAFKSNNNQTNIEGFCWVNEENNWGYSNAYWSGNASDYLRLLNIGIDESHKGGKWASNGGLTGQYLSFKVWEDYINRGYTDSAESYRIASGLPSNVATFRSNTSRQPQIYFIDTLIAAYAANAMDYVNFHIYVQDTALDTPLVMKADAAYLSRIIGKPVITNEYGIQVTGAASQLVALTRAGVEARLAVMIGYSGNPSYTWVDNNGVANTIGTAYKNYITTL